MSQVRLRQVLSDLPAYVAGKGDAGKVVKLSSNELPFPPAKPIIEAGEQALTSINRYPDAIGSALAAKLGAHYRLNPEQVVVGPGSIQVLANALSAVAQAGNNVVYAWRSFEAYPILVGITGASSRQIPLNSHGGHDLDAILSAVDENTAAVILCSPNNPTGTSLTGTQVREFLAALPTQVLAILDEAYFEFDTSLGHVDGATLLADFPNLLVLRTFSKAYGLAGLRCGYGLTSLYLAEAIRKVATPFGLSAVAEACALAALADNAAMLSQVSQICKERERVLSELRNLGWTIPQAGGNFIWFGAPVGAQIQAAALSQGVQTRGFVEGVRVTIGSRAENDQFLTAISSIKPS
ncbi:histidinol-phosphate transaminase [Varibaculum cambriense]|uniref:histidinol-phosphate transaminase n=1 Tax=Varibaculum cambriense TaxID=184870 RepID=UPI0028FE0575|nr:histidinol-phosphate transaminase [Varibaculum cambriense]MDU1224739.1 histidinol-phosphate transaminase [Varibaculum cambriense]